MNTIFSPKPNRLLALLSLCASLALGHAQGATYQKVLIVGDSITNHGPKADIGWTTHWGMAASAMERDYAHLFLAKVAAAQNGMAPDSLIFAEGGGKITDKVNFLDRFKAYQPDLAVIQLGENDNDTVTPEGFQAPYERILQAVREGNPKVAILCCGVWSPPSGNAVKDGFIRNACQKYNAMFVDLGAVNKDPVNKAGGEFPGRYAHNGVAWHPGDKGMQGYADALWKALQNPAAASTSTAPAAPAAPRFALEEKWAATPALAWNLPPKIEAQGGRNVVKLTAANAEGSVNIRGPLPVEKIKGKKLVISTRVRGENVSEKPLPHNGVKLMLATVNAEGVKNYPQAPLPIGTFDWAPVTWSVNIPDNIVEASLVLGLEKVSGTVWFDAVKITEQ